MAKAELVAREQNVAHVKIALEAAEVDRHFGMVYRGFAKEINVPGFRKGKVPPNVVRMRVGMEAIVEACTDALKEYAVGQAIEQLELEPRAGDTKWHSDPDPVEGEALAYELSFPVLPEVILPDYASYQLTAPKLEVTEGMKDRFRQRLTERFTEFPESTGTAGPGLACMLSFTSVFTDSGEASPLKHDELMFIMETEGNLPGWDEQIAGKSAGDTFSFEYAMPEDFADVRVAGKGLKIEMTVKSVHEVKTPALDEDFVKEKLQLPTLEAFEDYVDAALIRERDMQFEQVKRDLVMQKVIDELQADITEDMLNEELDGLVQENDRTLRQYNSTLEQYLKEKGQTLEQYREQLKGAALNKIKLFLAVRGVSAQEHIHAERDDYQRYAMYLIQREGVSPEQVGQLMRNAQFFNEATYQIVKEKVLEHIAQAAKFNVESTSVEDNPAEGAEASDA